MATWFPFVLFLCWLRLASPFAASVILPVVLAEVSPQPIAELDAGYGHVETEIMGLVNGELPRGSAICLVPKAGPHAEVRSRAPFGLRGYLRRQGAEALSWFVPAGECLLEWRTTRSCAGGRRRRGAGPKHHLAHGGSPRAQDPRGPGGQAFERQDRPGPCAAPGPVCRCGVRQAPGQALALCLRPSRPLAPSQDRHPRALAHAAACWAPELLRGRAWRLRALPQQQARVHAGSLGQGRGESGADPNPAIGPRCPGVLEAAGAQVGRVRVGPTRGSGSRGRASGLRSWRRGRGRRGTPRRGRLRCGQRTGA